MAPRLIVGFIISLLWAVPIIAADDTPPMNMGPLPAIIRESSGLAVSRRAPDLLWTHNDSGGEPVLYAISPAGELRGSLRINGIKNRDWEDLAAFELDGSAWLLIADTGDNASNRTDCALYIVAEPDPATLSPAHESTARVAWKIPVTYLDGPRDCEAVAVDVNERLVYLLAKRTRPHGLYTVPLTDLAGAPTPAALPVAQIPNRLIPQPGAALSMLPTPTGRYRAQPTGMDFAADGSAAVIVSYGDVLIFPRQSGGTWADALRTPPRVLAPHNLPQAEGVAFSPDRRSVYVSSEGDGSVILRYTPDETGSP